MRAHSTESSQLLLAYVADLELEVDRLRKRGEFIQSQTQEALRQIQAFSTSQSPEEVASPGLAQIKKRAHELATTLHDFRETPGYHPSHDQVVTIALRPLVEKVFRWQQRLQNAPDVALQLHLGMESLEWFPARLRHVLDNLLSNALKYRDIDKKEAWVRVEVRAAPKAYELLISDNGVGIPAKDQDDLFELFYRAAPTRAAGIGVGLAVVKLLVEQSGGTMAVNSGHGQGSAFEVVLPRYDVDDFLT